jgi:hypothetical protein
MSKTPLAALIRRIMNGEQNDVLLHEDWLATLNDVPSVGAGEQGPQGETGPTGATGPQGPKGDKGDKGDPGETGATGLTGPEGPEGPQGLQGPEGPAGADGQDGTNGTNGTNGTDGQDGSVDVSAAWPIGSVFISVVSTNPATLLGIGTWSEFAAGRVLVGLDAGQTEFDTVEETGGAKTHTLTTAEMPAHTHTQDAHNHIITSQTATTGGSTSYEHGTLDTSSADTEATEVTASTTAVNQNTGGGGAHNNLQPYITVYMWKRTA